MAGMSAQCPAKVLYGDRAAAPRAASQSVLYRGRFGLLDPLADHRPKLRRVLVGMNGHRVLHGCFDESSSESAAIPTVQCIALGISRQSMVLPGHTPSRFRSDDLLPAGQ